MAEPVTDLNFDLPLGDLKPFDCVSQPETVQSEESNRIIRKDSKLMRISQKAHEEHAKGKSIRLP